MATLDDKLMGEKLQYYCSSSESEAEGEGDEGDEDAEKSTGRTERMTLRSSSDSSPPQNASPWQGTSSNTGPKGVIKDFQRYKQLEREKRQEQKAELDKLTKKLALTCRTTAEDDKAAAEEEALDEELSQLLSDDFIHQFVQQRMQDMLVQDTGKKFFGSVQSLRDGDQFLKAVDEADKNVCVLVLLYEPGGPGCSSAMRALDVLAAHYPHIKFCSTRPSAMSMSAKFKAGGVPAILAYKAGQMTGNFIKISDDLGREFESSDLESFLIENGILNDRHLVPNLGRATTTNGECSDSD